jgi:hypothetical protein
LIFLPFRFSSSSSSWSFSLSSVASTKNCTSKSCLSLLSVIKVAVLFAISRNIYTTVHNWRHRPLDVCSTSHRNDVSVACTGGCLASAELCVVMIRSHANWSPQRCT